MNCSIVGIDHTDHADHTDHTDHTNHTDHTDHLSEARTLFRLRKANNDKKRVSISALIDKLACFGREGTKIIFHHVRKKSR